MTIDDHGELDDLPLTELVGRLRDVHTSKTPLGWPTEHAVTKSAVERRIVDLVIRRESQPVDDPAQRVACELAVKLRSGERPSIKADRVTVQPGGLFVETEAALELGDEVELELAPDGPVKLKVRGLVGYRAHGRPGQPAGLGVGFSSVVGDAAERRLERVVLELLRHRSH